MRTSFHSQPKTESCNSDVTIKQDSNHNNNTTWHLTRSTHDVWNYHHLQSFALFRGGFRRAHSRRAHGGGEGRGDETRHRKLQKQQACVPRGYEPP